MTKVLGSNVLITGGLGFIGSNLARKLCRQGAKVTIIDSLFADYGGNQFNIADIASNVDIHYLDIRNTDELKKLIIGKDFIFNLAAQSSHMGSMLDPIADLEINVTALVSMLELCKKFNPNVKVVHASTRQIYGSPDYLPVKESHPIRPVDVNGVNKSAAEQYLMLYNKVYDLRSCSLRLTNTYGPGMRVKDAKQTFLGIWIKSVLEHKPFSIYGDGLQVRDFNYVDDCSDAFILCAYNEISNGKVYNLGGTPSIELKALAKIITSLGFGGSYEFIPFPSSQKAIDIGDYSADISLIQADLKWFPSVELNDGLTNALAYYDKNRNHYW